MQTVIILIHLMIVLAMVGLVLLQKSEGGGLGMGGGGGGGFMSSRGTANVLTRTTGDPGGAVLRHQPVPVDPGGLRPQAALDPGQRQHPRGARRAGGSGRSGRGRRAQPARRRNATACAGSSSRTVRAAGAATVEASEGPGNRPFAFRRSEM